MASDDRSIVRVLAVDDEQAARKLLGIMLGPPAFYCTTAGNCEEALETLYRERFDVVISDLITPSTKLMTLFSWQRI
jgi:DNA-binding NtrC family response regulator